MGLGTGCGCLMLNVNWRVVWELSGGPSVVAGMLGQGGSCLNLGNGQRPLGFRLLCGANNECNDRAC